MTASAKRRPGPDGFAGRRRSHTIFLGLAWLLVLTIIVQFYLAGVAVFVDRSYWEVHLAFGHTGVAGAAFLALLAAAIGRLGRRTIGLAALLLVQIEIVQTLLVAWVGEAAGWKALHPVNALLIFWLALGQARRAKALPIDFHPTGIPKLEVGEDTLEPSNP
jgi:hypothetical protein